MFGKASTNISFEDVIVKGEEMLNKNKMLKNHQKRNDPAFNSTYGNFFMNKSLMKGSAIKRNITINGSVLSKK